MSDKSSHTSRIRDTASAADFIETVEKLLDRPGREMVATLIIETASSQGASEKIFNKNKESDTLNLLESLLSQHGFELGEKDTDGKRIYRKPEERPDPSKPRYAEVNRLKKEFKLRLMPELIEKVDAEAKARGITRQELVETILTNLVDFPAPKD